MIFMMQRLPPPCRTADGRRSFFGRDSRAFSYSLTFFKLHGFTLPGKGELPRELSHGEAPLAHVARGAPALY
jgi:hypothetical protein